MNSERSQSYGRVVHTLDEVGPTKLLPVEQDRIRNAADTLLFAADLEDARAALEDVTSLLAALVESGRWTQERANRMAEDLAGCGPLAAVG